jgi:hypothetical protein
LQKGAMELHSGQRKIDSLEGHSKEQISELKKHMQQTYEEQLKHITETVPFVSIFFNIHRHFISMLFNSIFSRGDILFS